MQFSVVAILPLLALAFAAPAPQTESMLPSMTQQIPVLTLPRPRCQSEHTPS